MAGADWIYLIRNASGHGLDLIEVTHHGNRRYLRIIEVKYNRARLSKDQRGGGRNYAEVQLIKAMNQIYFANFSEKNDRTCRLELGTDGCIREKSLPAKLATQHVRLFLEDRTGGFAQEQIDRIMKDLPPGERNPRAQHMPAYLPSQIDFWLARVTPAGEVIWREWQ